MPNINTNQSSDSVPLLSFASEDFYFSAWANLPVTPHLQQVIILDSVTSAARRRCLAERVGERRADAPPLGFLLKLPR